MAGPEEGWLLAPRSSTPGLALGTVGGSGSRSSGSSPAIDSCQQEGVTAPSSPSETGASAPRLSCLSMLCQARAPAPQPGVGWALSTIALAGGTFRGRGIFHRVFHMLAPALSPLCPQPRPSCRAPYLPPAPSLPTSPATGHCCSCATFLLHPLLCPLALALIVQPLALSRSHWHWFLLVGSLVVLGEGVLHPRMGVTGLEVQGRYSPLGCSIAWPSVVRLALSLGTAVSPGAGSVTESAAGAPRASSAPPFCRGSCSLVLRGGRAQRPQPGRTAQPAALQPLQPCPQPG